MRRIQTLVCVVKVSPWLRWYLSSVMLVAQLTGRQPNMAKVAYWVNRGVRVTSPTKGAVA